MARSPRKSPKRRSRRRSPLQPRKKSPRKTSRRRSPRRSKRKSKRKSKSRTRKLSGLKCALDAKCAMENFSSDKVKVMVKKGPKGVSLFAKKPIRKGNIIAYYKFKTYRMGRTGTRNDMYSMSVYTKKDNYNPRLIGDVFDGSLEMPKNNISFFAYFSNEPSGKQSQNAWLDTNTKQNYKDRSRLKPGDTMVYRLIASRNIKPGEEIVWCYGDAYGRDYDANC